MNKVKLLNIIGATSVLCSCALCIKGAYDYNIDVVCAKEDNQNNLLINQGIFNNDVLEYRYYSDMSSSLLNYDFYGNFITAYSFDEVYFSVKLYLNTLINYGTSVNPNYYCDVDVDIYSVANSRFDYMSDDMGIIFRDVGDLDLIISHFGLQLVNVVDVDVITTFEVNNINERVLIDFETFDGDNMVSSYSYTRVMQTYVGESDALVNGSASGSYNFKFSINSYLKQYLDIFNYGKNNVLNNLDDYNLYTKQDYLNYGVVKYNEGVAYASDNDLSFYTFIRTIFRAPQDLFHDAFNWTLPLGDGHEINMLPLMTFVLTMGIAFGVFSIVKKFL